MNQPQAVVYRGDFSAVFRRGEGRVRGVKIRQLFLSRS